MAESLATEIVVVGAGPAGIAAAVRLAESGRDVLLVDENQAAGGQIWRHRSTSDLPATALGWIERLETGRVRSLTGATVVDASVAEGLLVERSQQPIEIRSQTTVLATGARELFLPFPGWTLPGVVGVGAAQALVKSGVDVTGLEIVMAGSGPLLLPVSALLERSGARVSILAEQAPGAAVAAFALGLWRTPDKILEALRYRARTWRSRYRTGVWVEAAFGDGRVEEVELTDGRRRWRQPCDWLSSAYGLTPNLEIARWLGCRIESGRVVVDRYQRTDRPNLYCVGEATGIGGAGLSVVEGEIAAAHISGDSQRLPQLERRRDRLAGFARRLRRAFRPRGELASRVRPETIVCRCEDVRRHELDPEWGVRQAKLYTRLGMGPCQGRICGAAAAFLFDWQADTVRPPFKPCRIESLER